MLYKFAYLDLFGYVYGLGVFIRVWVFVMLMWQLWTESGACLLKRVDNLVEFFWTVLPRIMVFVLCVLNLRCLSYRVISQASEVVKVVGRQ